MILYLPWTEGITPKPGRGKIMTKLQFVATAGKASTTAWKDGRRLGHSVSVDVLRDANSGRYLQIQGAGYTHNAVKKLSAAQIEQWKDFGADELSQEMAWAFKLMGLKSAINA